MLSLFLWCNGGHYYRASSRFCPWSGYNQPLDAETVRYAASSREPGYEGLLVAGASEDHAMHALYVPPEIEGDPWPCSGYAPVVLVDLVATRNRWLLERFPCGRLAAEMVPHPMAVRDYVRRPGESSWLLIDEVTLSLGLSEHDDRLLRHLLKGDVEELNIERRSKLVSADHPPRAIGDELFDHDHRWEHPWIPRGHLYLEPRRSAT